MCRTLSRNHLKRVPHEEAVDVMTVATRRQPVNGARKHAIHGKTCRGGPWRRHRLRRLLFDKLVCARW